MTTIWQAFGGTLQPVLVAVVTVAALALLRLITPTVRWGRRLKQDADIFAAIPEGKEKAMWATRVTAQAERLRIYRENLSIGDQIFAWYAFSAVILTPIGLISDSAHEWRAVRELSGESIPGGIVFAVLLVSNYAFAVFIAVRLIRGQSTALRDGSGNHFPKYDRLRREERRRQAKRSKIELRLVALREAERTKRLRRPKP